MDLLISRLKGNGPNLRAAPFRAILSVCPTLQGPDWLVWGHGGRLREERELRRGGVRNIQICKAEGRRKIC